VAMFATFKTSLGDIRVQLKPESAPKTVENFVGLATGKKEWTDPRSGENRNDSLYAGTVFHRVIPNFMIQGGDPTGTGRGGPGYEFGDEVKGGPRFDGAGYLAMANAGPGTNGSQFFITTAATPHLTGKHTIFGEVVDDESRRVVDSIATTKAVNDRPVQDVVIQSVSVERR